MSAQALGGVESNIERCVIGKQSSEPRGGWPFRATHHVCKATSETLSVLEAAAKSNRDASSMPYKLKKQGKQMAERESDHRILPQLELFDASDTNNEKPSNAGAGKAVTPTRDSDHPPSIRSDGPTVTERLSYIHDRAQKQFTAEFDNVFHLLKYELLWHAFRRLKRNKAPGIDGQSVDDYEANLRNNLRDLASR